jgi:hypothetical protein
MALIVAACVMVLAVSVVQAAEEEKDGFQFTTYADYNSKYVSRGVNYSNESVFQPSVYVSRWGFTGSVWGNMDLKNNNGNAGDFTELDYTIDYTNNVPAVEWLNFSVGNIYYQYPSTDVPNTEEIYGGLGLNCTCDHKGTCLACLIAPSVKVYRDVDTSKGTYAQFNIGHTIEKGVPIADDCACDIVLGASLGYANSAYNSGNFGVNDSTTNDLTLTLGLPFVVKGVTIRPNINYSELLASDIRQASDHSDNLWGGVSVSYSF